MAAIDDLLKRIEDPRLRSELTSAVAEVRRAKDYGLVFESHLPETVRLPHHPLRRGVKVALRDTDDKAHWAIASIQDGMATLVPVRAPSGDSVDPEQAMPVDVAIADLVVVAEFGDIIYPGLDRVGSIGRGGDKPSHIIINGENHHVLEALQFTHAGKVDCIYIDPPYNTGARDWKYDNDYVDGEDVYRHSKWLAFMERRLRLARELLNPDESVLIVTIDEKEMLRLGMLLEQIFPGTKVQIATIVINAAGQSRKQELARVEEYAFFVFFGRANPTLVTDDLLNDRPSGNPNVIRWESLLRSGTNSRRADRPALFYPVFVDPVERRIRAVGDSKSIDAARSEWTVPADSVAVWPLKSDGSEGNWRTSPDYLRQLGADGFVRVGEYREDEGRGTVWYLGKSAINKIATGEILVTGRDEQGAVTVTHTDQSEGSRRTTAKTVWNRSSHHSGWYGSALIRALIPDRPFPFPKSLYAVEDALRIAIGDKRDAVVLDFFAGSGTTSHAVARLNHQDGGSRQSISVTNNQVAESEAKSLRKAGRRQGDPEWESLGIFEHVTRPRIEAAISGNTPEGTPVKGDYKFTDEFPMAEGLEENVEFLKLTYEDPARVELDLAFAAVAPLMWMRAGGAGPIIAERVDGSGGRKPFDWTDRYAVLFDTDRWQSFVAGLPDSVRSVFIVTDSQTQFAHIKSELPVHVTDTVRLYEGYLSTFAINGGAGG